MQEIMKNMPFHKRRVKGERREKSRLAAVWSACAIRLTFKLKGKAKTKQNLKARPTKSRRKIIWQKYRLRYTLAKLHELVKKLLL